MQTDSQPHLFRNIEQREPCVKCGATGRVHESQEKCETSSTKRCRKCIECTACEGSGFTIGKTACDNCSSRGFVHSRYALRPHVYALQPDKKLPPNIRCIDCTPCKRCKGVGVIKNEDLKKLEEEKNQSVMFQTFLNHPVVPKPMRSEIQPVNLIHPHFLSSIVPNFTQGVSQQELDIVNKALTIMMGGPVKDDTSANEVVDPRKEVTKCPLCSGNGYSHRDICYKGNKKPPTAKCKTCVDCKGCKGTGTVRGKKTCEKCMKRGFYHPDNTEREHDAPEHMRCFYCMNCQECKGTGLANVEINAINNKRQTFIQL